MEPKGTLKLETKRDWKVMAQQTCYADSPVMPLPFADIRPHGMNADDGYCCSSWAMTDLFLPKVSVYQARPDTPNPESRIWSEAGR